MSGMRGLQSVLIGVLLAVSLSGADETKASPSKAPRPQGPLKPRTTLPPVETFPPELEKTTPESQQGVKTPQATVKTPQVPVRPETTFPPVKTPQVPVRPETIVPPAHTPQVPVRPETTFPPRKTPQVPVRPETIVPPAHTPQVPVRPETTFPPRKTPQVPVRPETTFPPRKTPQVPVRPETTFPPVKTPQVPVRPETIVPPAHTPQAPVRPETTFPPVKIPVAPVKIQTTLPPVETLPPVTRQTTSAECLNEEDGEQTGCVTAPAPTTDSDWILSEPPQKACTTRWFNQDNPSGIGDNEILLHIMDSNPDAVCFNPVAIEVQTVDGIPASETGQQFFAFGVVLGFSCINSLQGKGKKCLDYKIRFICPQSFCSGGEVQTTPGSECVTSPAPIPTLEEAQSSTPVPVKGGPITSGPGVVGPSAPSPTLEQVQTSPKTTVQGVPIICKTRWFNQDNPSGDGDHELLADLQQEYPQGICSEPSDIEVQTVGGIPASETGQKFIVNDATLGFSCINEEQGKGQRCYDYRVRFTCPQSFCSGGEIPNTSGPETVTPPAPNPTLKQVQNTSSSPVKGQDQSVPVNPVTIHIDTLPIQTSPKATVPVCKTKWLNRDNPSSTGDYELVYYFRKEYPNAICPKPIALEVQTVDGIPAQQTGQKFARNDVANGFACINADQGKGGSCFDYKVRFTCPPSFCSGGGQKHPVTKEGSP